MLGASLRLGVRVVSVAPGLLRYQLAPGLAPLADAEIRKGLDNATGLSWQVERVTTGEAQPSLEEARAAAESVARDELRRSPLVAAALAVFPGAELIEDETPPAGERNWSRRA